MTRGRREHLLSAFAAPLFFRGGEESLTPLTREQIRRAKEWDLLSYYDASRDIFTLDGLLGEFYAVYDPWYTP